MLHSSLHIQMRRREFLLKSAASLLAIGVPGISFAQSFWDYPRSLWLKRPATGEEARVVYWANGNYQVDGYRNVCHLLRDVRANQTVAMDPVLLDILRGIQGWFEMAGIQRPIVLNSGYRSPTTNNAIEGASRSSQHLSGKAADIWIPDVPSDYLAKLAAHLRGGGVGIYPSKGFIHVDSGRLRSWRG